MIKQVFRIGHYKNGEHVAKPYMPNGEVYYDNLMDAQHDLVSIWERWEDKPTDEDDFDYTREVNIRISNKFTDDVHNYQIFAVDFDSTKDEYSEMITHYAPASIN